MESFVPNSTHLKADLDLCRVVGCVNGAALAALLHAGIKTGKIKDGVNPSSRGCGEQEPLQKGGHVPL